MFFNIPMNKAEYHKRKSLANLSFSLFFLRKREKERAMKWVVVLYDADNIDGGTRAIGPFNEKQAVLDYADEFGGAWDGYNVVPLWEPSY
jgi:hypothetical protein